MTCLLFRYDIAECAHHDRRFYTKTIDISLSTENTDKRRYVSGDTWLCMVCRAHVAESILRQLKRLRCGNESGGPICE